MRVRNVCSMLGQRLRRWPNIEQTLGVCPVPEPGNSRQEWRLGEGTGYIPMWFVTVPHHYTVADYCVSTPGSTAP